MRAVARAATSLENQQLGGHRLARELFPFSGQARIIGVTGPAGSGKSTLINVCTSKLRKQGRKVAVIATDPSSHITGGAILGDRIRMSDHSGDSGVFIRSAATRGHAGGIGAATLDLAILFDAAGFQDIFVESIGVGQDEVEIANIAHLSIVVLMPGAGDDVQAEKAGIMEIADIFAINKSDLPGASRLAEQVSVTQGIVAEGSRVPVIQVSALSSDGINELIEAMDSQFIRNSLPQAAQHRWRRILTGVVAEQTVSRLQSLSVAKEASEICLGRTDPYTAADRLMAEVCQDRLIDGMPKKPE